MSLLGIRLPQLSATIILIILTSIISILFFILGWFYPSLIDYVVLKADYIISGEKFWTLFTHIFLHGSIFHLFVNMFSLFFVGSVTESIIGRKRFVWFYFLSGIFAGLLYVFSAYFGTMSGYTSVFGDVNMGAVGASGALFGLLGILAVLIPYKRISLILGPLVVLIAQTLVSHYLNGALLTFVSLILNVLLFVTIIAMFSFNSKLRAISWPVDMSLWLAPIIAIVPLVIISLFVDLPIGNAAHIGGLIAGLVYGFYLRFKYNRKVNLLQRYFR